MLSAKTSAGDLSVSGGLGFWYVYLTSFEYSIKE